MPQTRPSLDAVWSFGGDYADIGSFPLDGNTVFGSHSDDADDVTSYDAALISQDGIRVLGCPSADALATLRAAGRVSAMRIA